MDNELLTDSPFVEGTSGTSDFTVPGTESGNG